MTEARESDGWVVRALGEIAETQLGKMLSAKARNGLNPRPYLGNKNVQWGRFDLSDLKQMHFSDEEFEKFGLRSGDLVVCEGGEVGRCAIWGGDEPMAIQKALHRVRPSDEVSSRWLYYYFQLLAASGGLADYTSGIGIPHLPQEDIRRIPIPYPPRPQQDRILAALERVATGLDLGNAELAEARELMGRLRLSQRRNELSRVGRPTQLLGDLVDVLDHQRVPVNRKERAVREGEVPYYGATGQVGWIDDMLFDEELVLLGEDGVQFHDPFAQKAYLISGPSWVNNHAHVLRPHSDLIRGAFLRESLNVVDYQGLANGTTRLKLTKSAMLRIRLWVPALDIQDEIVERLRQVEESVQQLLSVTEQTQRDASALFVGALREAMAIAPSAGSMDGAGLAPADGARNQRAPEAVG